jgi:hypothetical protein
VAPDRGRAPRADARAARGERGSALLTGVVVLAVVAVCLLGLARVGTAAVQRARADAVADLTALAAVSAGATGAARVATASGAELVEHHPQPDGSVRVAIQLGAARASAAAAPIGDPLTSDPDPETGRR